MAWQRAGSWAYDQEVAASTASCLWAVKFGIGQLAVTLCIIIIIIIIIFYSPAQHKTNKNNNS